MRRLFKFLRIFVNALFTFDDDVLDRDGHSSDKGEFKTRDIQSLDRDDYTFWLVGLTEWWQSRTRRDFLGMLKNVAVLTCMLLIIPVTQWSISKIGTMSQNLDIEFSQKHMNLTIFIEDLKWDPVGLMNKFRSSFSSTSNQDQRQQDFCVPFYNSLRMIDGPLCGNDDAIRGPVVAQDMNYFYPQDSPSKNYGVSESFILDCGLFIENGAVVDTVHVPDAVQYEENKVRTTTKLAFRHRLLKKQPSSSRWIDYLPRPVVAIEINAEFRSIPQYVPKADTLKSQILFRVPSSLFRFGPRENWVLSMRYNFPMDGASVPILPPIPEDDYYPLPHGDFEESLQNLVITTKLETVKVTPSPRDRFCDGGDSYEEIHCCAEQFWNHLNRNNITVNTLPWLAAFRRDNHSGSSDNLKHDKDLLQGNDANNGTRLKQPAGRPPVFKNCIFGESYGELSIDPGSWCRMTKNESNTRCLMIRYSATLPGMEHLDPMYSNRPLKLVDPGVTNNSACQFGQWFSANHTTPFREVIRQVKQAYDATSVFKCTCLPKCSRTSLIITSVRDGNVPRNSLEDLLETNSRQTPVDCSRVYNGSQENDGKGGMQLLSSNGIIGSAIARFREANGHKYMLLLGSGIYSAAWATIWLCCFSANIWQTVQQYNTYAEVPISTEISEVHIAQELRDVNFWFTRAKNLKESIGTDDVRRCSFSNQGSFQCVSIRSMDEPATPQSIGSLVTTKYITQPVAFATNFDERRQGNSIAGMMDDQTWLIVAIRNFTRGGCGLTESMPNGESGGKIEALLEVAMDVGDDLIFSVHAPVPATHADKDFVQPFATVDDGKVMLKPGFAYSIQAKVTVHRRLVTSLGRCTEDAETANSWEVAKRVWRHAYIREYGDPSFSPYGPTLCDYRCSKRVLMPIGFNSSNPSEQLSLSEEDITYANLRPCDNPDRPDPEICDPLVKASYTKILFKNFSQETLKLPFSVSNKLPCFWETVTFTQVSRMLYQMKKGRENIVRLSVTFDPNAEVLQEQLAYDALKFVSDWFGILGLYLGYSALSIWEIFENLFLATPK